MSTDSDKNHTEDSRQPLKTGIVGGGRTLKRLLELLDAIEKSTGKVPIRIVAVADPKQDAPGMVLARRKGITTYNDYHSLFGFEGLEMIVELTSIDDISHAIRDEIPPHLSFMDHRAAWSVWNTFLLQELRINQIRQEAHAQRMAAVNEMSTYFAHEIRNPLMSIGGFAQSLINTDCLKGEACLRRAQVIVNEARRLEEVLRDVWDLTRPLVIEKAEDDLNQVVLYVLELLHIDLETAGIEVVNNLDPNIRASLFDPHLIRQVCLNILKNSIESMPKGGRIEVRTRREWGFIFFCCKDHGVGIDATLLHEVFNPFFTTKDGAAGMGLAMCKRIIEDHGGEINVASAVGEGTNVEFFLPYEASTDSAFPPTHH